MVAASIISIFLKLKFFLCVVLRVLLNWCYGGGKCMICSRETVAGDICFACREKYLYSHCRVETEGRRCSVCGKRLLSEDNLCMDCREHKVINSCDFVFPILSYRLWAKTVMFQWKTNGHRGLSWIFAKLCHRALSSFFADEPSVIVPVPPRPGKIRKIGWDQVDELCRILEHKYGHRVMRLLERTNSVQQKKLDRDHRLHSESKRYVLSKKGLALKRENIPECVILIDDVMTTGITVESCAAELKSVGISKVKVLTIFVVD